MGVSRGVRACRRFEVMAVAGALMVGAAMTGCEAAVIDTPTEAATDFENGQLSPWAVLTTSGPNYVHVVTPSFGAADGTHAAEFFWTQAGYDGTRLRRGAEMGAPPSFTKEGWQAYSLYVPSVGFPTDKTEAISQIFCGGGTSYQGSWGALIDIQNNSLGVSYRGNDVASQPIHQVLATVPRDTWFRIIVHFVASHAGKGEIQIWANGAPQNKPSFEATNINFGFGDWDPSTDSLLTNNSQIGLKFGMYNWDSANYTPGETRTLYYDDPFELVGGGTAGYQLAAAVPTPTPEPAAGLFVPTAAVPLLLKRRGLSK